MSGLLPPPHLLNALIATARYGSVVRAAEELHLTASAVSRQLNELERTFGLPLFSRVRNRLQLTDAGQRYVEGVVPLLGEIERLTLELRAQSGAAGAQKQPLQVSTLPTFGARWLIPRLSDFFARHPHVDLGFVPFAQGYDFSNPRLDCAIRYGKGMWPGARADYLLGREVVVIAPPGEGTRLGQPEDVRAFTFIHHATEPEAWARWCAHHRISCDGAMSGPRLDQISSQVQAVISGLGIALVPRALVQDEIGAGTVFEAPFPPFEEAAGYYLCYPESKARMPALEAFRMWVLEQVGTS